MNKAPKIGERVEYIPPEGEPVTVGRCVGIVTAIYETYDYDEDALDAADSDHEIFRARRGLRAERCWRVGMRPDAKPEPWCYGKAETFAPEVSTLRKVRGCGKFKGVRISAAGQTLVEYTLVLVAIAAVAIGAYVALGHSASAISNQVNAAFTEVLR